MRVLFLFFTQAEAGAPGFLSRRGEDSAANLAESLGQFLENSLQVDLTSGLPARALSLAEDLRWKAHRSQASLPVAVLASLALFPQVLLISGAQVRSLKTSEVLASEMGIPVCVDERLDLCAADKPQNGALVDALAQLVGEWLPPGEPPGAVLAATSVNALLEWLALHMDAEKHKSMAEVFFDVTEQGILPTVFACGMERHSNGSVQWVFD